MLNVKTSDSSFTYSLRSIILAIFSTDWVDMVMDNSIYKVNQCLRQIFEVQESKYQQLE